MLGSYELASVTSAVTVFLPIFASDALRTAHLRNCTICELVSFATVHLRVVVYPSLLSHYKYLCKQPSLQIDGL